MARVLGINYGHDAGAALVIDGEVVASATEERFVRLKHYAGLPIRAIEFCLEKARISVEDLDEIALSSLIVNDGLLSQLFNLDLDAPKARVGAGNGVQVPPIYYPRWKTTRRIPASIVDHHLAHAASAFYTSGRAEETLVFTADGLGDGVSIAVWRATPPGRFECLYREGEHGSLAWFYGLVTEALGWCVCDGEGKTMGLAPYGSTERIEGILDAFCPRYERGELVAPHDFGRVGIWEDTGSLHWHSEEAATVRALVDKYGREAVAAEAQRVLEREMLGFVRAWVQREGTRAACFAGGLMLNVKMNQRIWESGILDVQHIFPDAGDAGLPVGAALHRSAQHGGPVMKHALRSLYWGPEYEPADIKRLLDERHLTYRTTSDPARAAAERLAAGKIVGWFQGRMEAGPRALGGRSILMDPRNARNKDTINSRVKFREGFRPFCPSMTEAAAREMLAEGFRSERFMTTSFDVRAAWRDRIGAVVHVDGTARPQVVEEAVNPRFYQVLEEFGARTGVECLLNTSFNIKGEPIVCSPREALRCFFDTGLDSLVIEDFVLDK